MMTQGTTKIKVFVNVSLKLSSLNAILKLNISVPLGIHTTVGSRASETDLKELEIMNRIG